MRKTANKRSPVLNEHPALSVEGVEEVTTLDAQQLTDRFLAQYMDRINPVGRYRSYFDSSAKGVDHLMKEVKVFYKKLVLDGNWSEEKYVNVLDQVFRAGAPLGVMSLENHGRRYDSGSRQNPRRR